MYNLFGYKNYKPIIKDKLLNQIMHHEEWLRTCGVRGSRLHLAGYDLSGAGPLLSSQQLKYASFINCKMYNEDIVKTTQ